MNLELFLAGGPIMGVILALSVLALAVVLERFFFFRHASSDPEALELALCEAIHSGDRKGASQVVTGGDSSLHRLFTAAVNHWAVGPEAMKELMAQQVRRELFRWEKGLNVLATIARVGPLLGLLGTVLGMIDIFRVLPEGGGGDMASLAGGIWKALLTTVAGLSLAVPIILAHSFLQNKVENQEETLLRSVDFIVRERMLNDADLSESEPEI